MTIASQSLESIGDHFAVTTGRSKRHWLSLILVVLLVLVGGLVAPVVMAAPAEAATTRVCSPSGKCVNATIYCPPGSSCGSAIYRKANPGEYCSSSVGCFTWNGTNYFAIGARPTGAQDIATKKCVSSLGYVWLTAIAGTPWGWTVGGVLIAVWGCS